MAEDQREEPQEERDGVRGRSRAGEAGGMLESEMRQVKDGGMKGEAEKRGRKEGRNGYYRGRSC